MTVVDGTARRRGPLHGYRVLDLADEFGQLAARLLGDLGADVIKVEMPRRGDRTRSYPPFYKDQPGPENSLFWWAMNAGKRSVTCALQVEAGRELFHRLAAVSDVVIETNQPGTQAALGIDYATLSRVNPGLVLISISPWGQSATDKKHRSNDLVASAMNGLMHFDPSDEEAAPWRTVVPQTYVHLNARAATEAATALFARGAHGGNGCHIDLSLQEVAAALGARRAIVDESAGRRTYQAADGVVVTPPFGGLQGTQGPALADWLVENGSGGDVGTPHWRARLAAGPLDASDQAVVEATLDRFCATRARDWLVTEAQKRGVAWTPVNSIGDAVESPQLKTQDAWGRITHDDGGESFFSPAAPWRFRDGHSEAPARAPHIGEHNVEIYTGLLGMDEADVRRLRTRMVV